MITTTRHVTAAELADNVRKTLAAAAPTVALFVAAGTEYERTGRWPDHVLDDPYVEWRDLWNFGGGRIAWKAGELVGESELVEITKLGDTEPQFVATRPTPLAVTDEKLNHPWQEIPKSVRDRLRHERDPWAPPNPANIVTGELLGDRWHG